MRLRTRPERVRPISCRRWSILLLSLSLLLAFAGCTGQQSATSSTASSGRTIVVKGSDTLVNLALAWAEAYMQQHPGARISVTGGGSGTGISALINKTTDIADASRQIKPEEVTNATQNGVTPNEIVCAYDAIAVIVHPSNPVSQLTLQQLSDIYTGKVTNWKEVGGDDRPIVLLSRESNSGTYVYFLENVVRLGQADNPALFSPNALLMPSSEGIGNEIRQNPNTIGYDGLGYVGEGQKVIAVAKDANGPFVLPSADTVRSKDYPIARELYMYTSGQPTGEIKDYIDWILSDGQAIVTQLGFVPLQ